MKWRTKTEDNIGKVCILLVIFASAFLLGMFTGSKKKQAEIEKKEYITDEQKTEMHLFDIACLISNKDISYEETYEIAIENGCIWDNPTQMIDELVQMGYLFYIPSYTHNGVVNEETYVMADTIAYNNAKELGVIE